MKASPLALEPSFQLGLAPISKPVVITWALMSLLVVASALATRRLSLSIPVFEALYADTTALIS